MNKAIESLFSIINRPECSVSELIGANIANAIRIHSASGGSSNLIMHIVGAMIYAGYDFRLEDIERILQEYPIPDLYDYSLTEGRDIYALAQQCCTGQIRGMETLVYELNRNHIPMDLDAPTVTGQTWRERLSNTEGLSADGVKINPIILSKPKRSFSGVDVLRGNFFKNAIVKISGMTSEQLDQFDEKVAFVLYYENEKEANQQLLDVNLLDNLKSAGLFKVECLRQMALHHTSLRHETLLSLSYEELFDWMVANEALKIAVIISGQGPEAFGMPEMFTPMQHINAHRQLKRLTILISDGRYSGVTFGAAIGHMTPEAFHDGGILYLAAGDLLHLQFRKKTINLLDEEQFVLGQIVVNSSNIRQQRQILGQSRMESLRKRQKQVAASNRLRDCTDASLGVVPNGVWLETVK